MMPDESSQPTTTKDWALARPVNPPPPSLAPAAFSLGVTLIIWGLISSLIITIVGLVVFVISLTEWIKEIRHARQS